MYAKVLAILCSLLLILGVGGCQRKEKEVENPKENIVQEEPELDLDALREEYYSLLDVVDHVMFTITNDGVENMWDAMELLSYLNQNRIEPTQELTIQLNQLIDELIDTGINYYIEGNNEVKIELADQLSEILNNIQEVMEKIEALLEIENNNL